MKIENVVKKFNEQMQYTCPHCHKVMRQINNSLICEAKHNFDFSKKGYIHLIPNYKATKYSTELFLARNYVFKAGYYDHVIEEIANILRNFNNINNVLDVGCGEGFYIKRLKQFFPSTYFYGLDNSKDALEVAGKNDKDNPYVLADLTKLPFSNTSIDVILNILTPANYAEFSRILTTNKGVLIKIIPTQNYLKEIRDLLAIDNYSNDDVTTLLEKNFDIKINKVVTKKFDLDEEAATNFLKMTPLTFSREVTQTIQEQLKNITIELVIVVAIRKG